MGGDGSANRGTPADERRPKPDSSEAAMDTTRTGAIDDSTQRYSHAAADARSTGSSSSNSNNSGHGDSDSSTSRSSSSPSESVGTPDYGAAPTRQPKDFNRDKRSKLQDIVNEFGEPSGSRSVEQNNTAPKQMSFGITRQQQASARSWARQPQEAETPSPPPPVQTAQLQPSVSQTNSPTSPVEGRTATSLQPPQRSPRQSEQPIRQEIALRFPRDPRQQWGDDTSDPLDGRPNQQPLNEADAAARLTRLRQRTTLSEVASQRSEPAVRVMQSQHTKEALEQLPEVTLARGWEQEGEHQAGPPVIHMQNSKDGHTRTEIKGASTCGSFLSVVWVVPTRMHCVHILYPSGADDAQQNTYCVYHKPGFWVGTRVLGGKPGFWVGGLPTFNLWF